MTEMASLVLFAVDPTATAAFYRCLGLELDHEDHGEGPLADVSAPVLTAHEVMPWGCRVVAEDPDGRAVEINQRHHCPGKLLESVRTHPLPPAC